MYKKSRENAKALYLDCLNEPTCIAGARYDKDSHELVVFLTHSDEKPDEHLIFKIAFEAFLKVEARDPTKTNVSVLNLYKHAKNTQFKGIWLPTDHQSTFLAKLRRLREYEKEKPKKNIHDDMKREAITTADAASSAHRISD